MKAICTCKLFASGSFLSTGGTELDLLPALTRGGGKLDGGTLCVGILVEDGTLSRSLIELRSLRAVAIERRPPINKPRNPSN